jgi:hypothetical protein
VTANVLHSLDEIAERQQLVVSRAQLLAHGVDDPTMSRRVSRGDWQRPAAAVYVLQPSPLSSEQRRLAAALYLGPDCQITGLSALQWYGFRHAPAADKVHGLVPHRMRRRSTGVIVALRTEEMDDRPRDGGLYQVASPARAVVDAGRVLGDLRSVRAIFTEAVQAGHTDVQGIELELRRARRSRTAIANRVLRELVDGVRSAPEAELRELVRSSQSLPDMRWNPILVNPDGARLPSPDGYLVETGVAIEVDSREHHLSSEDFQRTLDRGNLLGQYGIVVLHFTPTEIRTSPARVLRMIEATHRERAARPIPVRIRVVPAV